MPELYPQLRDIRWGPYFNQRLDILRHPVRDPGGNPWLIYRHGGGSEIRDKRLTWLANGNSNSLAAYLTRNKVAASDQHFDVIALDSRQVTQTSQLGTHTQNDNYKWCDPIMDRPVFFPQVYDEIKQAIIYVKSNAKDLGLDPDKGIGMGTSFGAMMMWYSQISGPAQGELSRYSTPDVDSRLKGIIFHQGQADNRNDYQEQLRVVTNSALVYTSADRRLTASGQFTYYDQCAAGGVVQVVSGTGAVAGTYGVEYVDPAGAFIVLDRGGAATDGATNVVITYTGRIPPFSLTSCTVTTQTGGQKLTKTGAFKVFGHIGQHVAVLSGTGATVQEAQIVSRVDDNNIIVDRIIATSGSADVAVSAHGDLLLWSILRSFWGYTTQATFDKVSKILRRYMSCGFYLQDRLGSNNAQIRNKYLDYYVPTFWSYEVTGDHVRPYGVTGSGDPHDSSMVAQLQAYSQQARVFAGGQVMNSDWGDSDPNVHTHSETHYRFMSRCLGGLAGAVT